MAGKQKFQVLLVVPRDFGAINQRYGHQTGNEFLYAIVLWLEETYREAAVYRYIGVTFAVIFPYSDSALADRYARELEERFEQPWVIGQYEETITAAFGSMVHTGEIRKKTSMMELLGLPAFACQTFRPEAYTFRQGSKRTFPARQDGGGYRAQSGERTAF